MFIQVAGSPIFTLYIREMPLATLFINHTVYDSNAAPIFKELSFWWLEIESVTLRGINKISILHIWPAIVLFSRYSCWGLVGVNASGIKIRSHSQRKFLNEGAL